ncbi:hypothetical protein NDN08_003181 [Rhodosorus marinus]|uniref:Serine/threonine-protein kinase PLK n=2 Tax=Rhodosorus marinus TaxID=101924 RepID=A0AAV8UYL0_9RHOD|nr:hypothetical protein NDN08_003181 [Rhodosorus marinus]
MRMRENGETAATLKNSEDRLQVAKTVFEKTRDGRTIREYERGHMLGKGGFARVYLFREKSTERVYAAKVVTKCAVKKHRAREKLMSEIRIHRSLKHPNIVRFVRCFEDENHVYILLDLCDSGSLTDLVRARGHLTEDEARPILRQLIEAVSFMHSRWVIHRDIKLGNILIHKDSTVRVGDFGLAAQLESDKQRKMTICGTPNYIAPEVLDGGREGGHSFEVDVWSIGVVVYTVLVGRPPFETSDVKQTYRRIKNNDYKFPSDLRLSREAKGLITAILSSAPEQRPLVQDLLKHEFFDPKILQVTRRQPSGAPLHEPMRVCKWIDYSSKYGLGYQLRDGTFGVYFNDATKMLLSGASVEYINASGGFEGRVRSDEAPAHLKKKVTLLNNFKSYLQARKSSGQEEPTGDENEDGSVYVRRWWHVKHAFLFQLSGGEIQANFDDSSEVVLCSRTGVVSYRSKKGRRETFLAKSLPDMPDLARRLKYLQQSVPTTKS